MRRAVIAAAVALLTLAGAPAAGATPGPPAAPEYWFDAWHLESLWASGVRGQGITIAEIDTGVNAALPQLRGRVLSGTDLGRPGNGQVDREINSFGHGTAMASIMVGRPGPFGIKGIAPDAKVLPIAVPLDGTTDGGQPDHLPQAITYAADHGAKIINMSLGGKRSPGTNDQSCPDDEQAAVFHAMRKGALVVASVGNTGPMRNTVEEPGVCLGVVSVGATDISGTVASFSSRQPYLTLVAPGVGVASLGRIPGQAFSGKGTSQSTAIASAAIALVWSKYPTEGVRTILARVLATLDARRPAPSSSYGYGLIDAYRAVTARVPAAAPNPVFAAAQPFLQRADALRGQTLGPAPKPAARAGTPPGRYAVGSATRFATAQVRTGLGLAVAGLVLLVALGLGALRGRRRRRTLGPPPLPAWPGTPYYAPTSGWPQYYGPPPDASSSPDAARPPGACSSPHAAPPASRPSPHPRPDPPPQPPPPPPPHP